MQDFCRGNDAEASASISSLIHRLWFLVTLLDMRFLQIKHVILYLIQWVPQLEKMTYGITWWKCFSHSDTQFPVDAWSQSWSIYIPSCLANMKSTFNTKSPKSITTKRQFKQHFFISQWVKLAQCSFPGQRHLKLLELLLGSSSFCHFEHVEPHSFAEGSALSNSHNVSNCDISAEGKSGFSDWDSRVPEQDNVGDEKLHQSLPKAMSSEHLELGRPSWERHHLQQIKS